MVAAQTLPLLGGPALGWPRTLRPDLQQGCSLVWPEHPRSMTLLHRITQSVKQQYCQPARNRKGCPPKSPKKLMLVDTSKNEQKSLKKLMLLDTSKNEHTKREATMSPFGPESQTLFPKIPQKTYVVRHVKK